MTASTIVQGMRIACAPGWQDRSMLVLCAGQAGVSGVEPNLVVTREAMPGDGRLDIIDRLERHVDGQIEAMRGLEDFALTMRRAASPSNPAVEVTIDWRSDGVAITQWITYAATADDMLVIATATAGRTDFDATEPTFRAMLETFQAV